VGPSGLSANDRFVHFFAAATQLKTVVAQPLNSRLVEQGGAMSHRPVLGGNSPIGFESQFPTATISMISASATLVEQLANDGSETVVSHGSGCFWRHQGVVYLLTARHVLSGRSPFDDSILSPTGYIPQRFRVYPMLNLGSGQLARTMTNVSVPNEHSFLQDPKFADLRTDIAALACMTDPDGVINCLNDAHEIFEDVFTHVGMECAIVGYPTNHFGNLMMPVWRRGAIASEPLLPVDDKPMFLLDASTSPGFSGAPVFRRHIGPLPQLQSDGSLNILADRVMTTSFVGIYAGRLQHPHFGGEVPYVFYANRIPAIFSSVPNVSA
jgi:hypothetical protein